MAELHRKAWQQKPVYERVMARCLRVGECLIWQGAKQKEGYGHIGRGGKVVSVHRVVYEHHFGPIPSGLQIDHVKSKGCTSVACCEISHLEAVTGRENSMRGNTLIAKNVAATHCSKGHPFSGHNLYFEYRKDGYVSRKCRACGLARDKARRKRGHHPKNTRNPQ